MLTFYSDIYPPCSWFLSRFRSPRIKPGRLSVGFTQGLTLYNTWGKKIECAGCRSLEDSGEREEKVNSAGGKRKCQDIGNLHKSSGAEDDGTWEVGQWKKER